MRTLCDVCEAAAARFFCAADEAALCSSCDEKVHSCNKLASRHVRLELTEARSVPQCDICESAPAFFYCEVDGTSLCLQCDMDVHVGGKRTHERYLLMGQRVELPNRPRIEDGSVPKGRELPIGKKRRLRLELHHQFLRQQQNLKRNPMCRDDWKNGSATVVTTPLKETGRMDAQQINLNSKSPHLHYLPVHAGQGGGENEQQVLSSDDECAGVVPELSSKDTYTSE
eukprot:c17288_g1_i2 orf=325-1005(+)